MWCLYLFIDVFEVCKGNMYGLLVFKNLRVGMLLLSQLKYVKGYYVLRVLFFFFLWDLRCRVLFDYL